MKKQSIQFLTLAILLGMSAGQAAPGAQKQTPPPMSKQTNPAPSAKKPMAAEQPTLATPDNLPTVPSFSLNPSTQKAPISALPNRAAPATPSKSAHNNTPSAESGFDLPDFESQETAKQITTSGSGTQPVQETSRQTMNLNRGSKSMAELRAERQAAKNAKAAKATNIDANLEINSIEPAAENSNITTQPAQSAGRIALATTAPDRVLTPTTTNQTVPENTKNQTPQAGKVLSVTPAAGRITSVTPAPDRVFAPTKTLSTKKQTTADAKANKSNDTMQKTTTETVNGQPVERVEIYAKSANGKQGPLISVKQTGPKIKGKQTTIETDQYGVKTTTEVTDNTNYIPGRSNKTTKITQESKGVDKNNQSIDITETEVLNSNNAVVSKTYSDTKGRTTTTTYKTPQDKNLLQQDLTSTTIIKETNSPEITETRSNDTNGNRASTTIANSATKMQSVLNHTSNSITTSNPSGQIKLNADNSYSITTKTGTSYFDASGKPRSKIVSSINKMFRQKSDQKLTMQADGSITKSGNIKIQPQSDGSIAITSSNGTMRTLSQNGTIMQAPTPGNK